MTCQVAGPCLFAIFLPVISAYCPKRNRQWGNMRLYFDCNILGSWLVISPSGLYQLHTEFPIILMPKAYPQVTETIWVKEPRRLHRLQALQLLLNCVPGEPGKCHPLEGHLALMCSVWPQCELAFLLREVRRT